VEDCSRLNVNMFQVLDLGHEMTITNDSWYRQLSCSYTMTYIPPPPSSNLGFCQSEKFRFALERVKGWKGPEHLAGSKDGVVLLWRATPRWRINRRPSSSGTTYDDWGLETRLCLELGYFIFLSLLSYFTNDFLNGTRDNTRRNSGREWRRGHRRNRGRGSRRARYFFYTSFFTVLSDILLLIMCIER
jgi:hypothetical protein